MTIKTVGELRKLLEGVDQDMQVVVYREDAEHQTSFFEIAEASTATGRVKRHPNGEIGMTFDRRGPDTWMLLTITEP